MSDRITEVFELNQGWYVIEFEELEEGMLFKMSEPFGDGPVLYEELDRWVVLKAPYYEDGRMKVGIRKYVELVGNF